ncbi:MAG TPA: hypothetical protein VI792_05395 [Candidatus Eisenbacteria bacterium]
MTRTMSGLLLAALLLPGCYDTVAPRIPPASPRGVYSVTGDGEVTLYWLANTEPWIAGYNVYVADCLNGPNCPYRLIATTTRTSYVVTNLVNGQTLYYAVTAFYSSGQESELSHADISDTPRPAGYGAVLSPLQTAPTLSGWDFSAYTVRPWDDPRTDMYFSSNGSIDEMLTPDPATTSIQDMGFAPTLDAVDFAPPAGWSPTGSVELIVGHNYVVWTSDNHFAKFRVTGLGSQVVFDWAYQIDAGNGQLRSKPALPGALRPTSNLSARATSG